MSAEQPLVLSPQWLSGTPGVFRRPAPALGENNREILLPLLGEDDYARLTAQGVILPR